MVWDNLNDKLTYFDSGTSFWEGETWTPATAGKEAQQENLAPGFSQGFVLDPTGFTAADGFATEHRPGAVRRVRGDAEGRHQAHRRAGVPEVRRAGRRVHSRGGSRDLRAYRPSPSATPPLPTPRGFAPRPAMATAASSTCWPSSTPTPPSRIPARSNNLSLYLRQLRHSRRQPPLHQSPHRRRPVRFRQQRLRHAHAL